MYTRLSNLYFRDPQTNKLRQKCKEADLNFVFKVFRARVTPKTEVYLGISAAAVTRTHSRSGLPYSQPYR